MNFKLDTQTIEDLDLFQTSDGRKSIYDLFDFCYSYGGKKKLKKIMSLPSEDIHLLNARKETVLFFQSNIEQTTSLGIHKNDLDFIEYYLSFYNAPTRKPHKYRVWERALIDKIKPKNENYIIYRGVEYTIDLLKNINAFFRQLDYSSTSSYLTNIIEEALTVLSQKEFEIIFSSPPKSNKLTHIERANLDYVFRYKLKYRIRHFLDLVYYFDVIFSLTKAMDKYGLSYPELVESSARVLQINGLFHPLLKNPVKNDIKMDVGCNLLFVSGPNMSGKSTLLKSLGVAAYLAHIGFPVPASEMKISMLSGIYSTINLSDNLHDNYSHFYSEVRRIKEIASAMNQNENFLVIFDELFRGTNIKDAYDGTLAVISAFAQTNKSLYIISTHILEVAEKLQHSNVQFLCLETFNENGTPRYTYKVKNGISDERLGMYIIRKEKIIEKILEANSDLKRQSV